mgnify:CR=1 FL=1|jgi:serine/threonine protein kinase
MFFVQFIGFLTNLVFQILDDPSPTPPKDSYSSEFCSFINDCLQKDADARPSCEQVKRFCVMYVLIFKKFEFCIYELKAYRL